MMRRRREVSLGQRFVPCDVKHPRMWEVEYAYVDAQGIPHVRLFDVTFPATKRTVATAVLLDATRFAAVAAG